MKNLVAPGAILPTAILSTALLLACAPSLEAGTVKIPVSVSGSLFGGPSPSFLAKFKGQKGGNKAVGSVKGKKSSAGIFGTYRAKTTALASNSSGVRKNNSSGKVRVSRKVIRTPDGKIKLKRPLDPAKLKNRIKGRGVLTVQVP